MRDADRIAAEVRVCGSAPIEDLVVYHYHQGPHTPRFTDDWTKVTCAACLQRRPGGLEAAEKEIKRLRAELARERIAHEETRYRFDALVLRNVKP